MLAPPHADPAEQVLRSRGGNDGQTRRHVRDVVMTVLLAVVMLATLAVLGLSLIHI